MINLYYCTFLNVTMFEFIGVRTEVLLPKDSLEETGAEILFEFLKR